ncbi:MAG: ISAs1 family transposase, partial [Deltaproteobacteria bacterium]|nr:ISAs1 family transposase [Deltaproteobacteria bacterium]
VPTVRTVLAQPALQKRKMTLDAAHCNPATTAQIHQAHGGYLVQLKANQPLLFAAVQALTTTAPPLGTHAHVDKGHGRLEERQATFFSLAALALPPRWQHSGLCSVVCVARTTTHLATGKVAQAHAYYLTNQAAQRPAPQAELTAAIRGHWGCEADHWRRDVTLQEDQVRVKHPTQAHVLGVLRTVVMRVFRCVGAPNYQALIETLVDSPARFTKLLRQVGFL